MFLRQPGGVSHCRSSSLAHCYNKFIRKLNTTQDLEMIQQAWALLIMSKWRLMEIVPFLTTLEMDRDLRGRFVWGSAYVWPRMFGRIQIRSKFYSSLWKRQQVYRFNAKYDSKLNLVWEQPQLAIDGIQPLLSRCPHRPVVSTLCLWKCVIYAWFRVQNYAHHQQWRRNLWKKV